MNSSNRRSYQRDYHAKQQRYRTDRTYRRRQLEAMLERHQELRLAALKHYSEGLMRCRWCGIPDVRVLCLDHIADDGKTHRQEVGTGTAFLRAIAKAGYPPILQVLCFNCNYLKHLGASTTQPVNWYTVEAPEEVSDTAFLLDHLLSSGEASFP